MIVKVSCIQLNCTDNMPHNLAQAERLIRQAKQAGAQLVVTPENSAIMVDPAHPAPRYPMEEHPAVLHYCQLARELKLWLVIGSIAVSVEASDRLANRSLVIDDSGAICSYYDKIHLFDVTLPNGEEYRESSRCLPGTVPVVSDTPWGKVGLSICYDVRFPHLYRFLARNGASFLTIPAAFTMLTGQAHWHVLVRARAIETGCYVFAAAQTGMHPGNRQTYGHSLIVSPWGEIVAEAQEGEGMIIAEIDTDKVAEVRRRIPSLQQD